MLKRVRNFFRLNNRNIGPFKNLDFGSCFFFIIIDALIVKRYVDLSFNVCKNADLTIKDLSMLPFIIYLYLKPLYSLRGGSTIRAEPFIKKLGYVVLRLNPLYKWNIFFHLTFVLSVTKIQDSFNNKYTYYSVSKLIGIAPM